MAKARKLGRPRGATGADTTKLILDEAEGQFAAVGYAMTTNKTIADACGLTTAAVYHYFGTKTGLYTAVSAHVYPPMLTAFEARIEAVQGFRAQLKAILDVSVELNQQRRSLAGFVMGGPVEARRHPELRPTVDHHFAQIEALIRKLVDDGKAAGELLASADSEHVVVMVLSVLHGFAHLAYSDDSSDHHTPAVRTFEMLLDGVLITDAA